MDTVCPITDRLCEGNVEEAAIELLPLALAKRLAEVTELLRQERQRTLTPAEREE